MNQAPNSINEPAVLYVVSGDATKSDKIRRLDELGLARADIARALGIRYQFVRNVLVEDERRRASRKEEPVPDGESNAPRSPTLAAGTGRMSAVGATGHAPGGMGDAGSAAFAGSGTPSTEPLHPVRTTLAAGGRLTIPEHFLAALGIGDEDDVFLQVEEDEIRIYSRDKAIEQVQELVAKYVPSDVGLVDALIAERRREFLNEGGNA